MPQLTTAFSLLLGLGARILYNKFYTYRPPGIEDHVLSGLWQGVALYYVLMEFPFLTLPVGFGIGARLLVNFVITYDAAGCACTLLGVAVGVLFTDILSQLLEDGDPEDAYYEADPSVTTAVTNTTGTWDSLSDWVDPNHAMTPLEREVAALRKKASMADSERRRFKEEKQWAQVQGNKARAAQMGWQVKRYSALMQSFHREADLRLLEANNERHRQEVASMQASASQVAGPSSTSVPQLPAPQPVAITFGGPSRTSQRSPPPRLVPPPNGEERERPLRSAIAQGKQPERRQRRISATADKDGSAMKAGSVFTNTHYPRRRAASALSRPSVRIEVHEIQTIPGGSPRSRVWDYILTDAFTSG
ncbi:hypothetical protein F5148DRAFT_1301178 [Russula earlei]|uniref:Uncharacterized protein n=1 Tax=Russula earlei TaxID=71964 RepID=A0ACC0TW88_9AGAM|nr:hypothetical protein F5148DRAFT_1301178 [Russula earlei]